MKMKSNMSMVRQGIVILFIIMFSINARAQDNKIGHWLEDESGLPAFSYTGALPYSAVLSNGQKVKIAEDPWFLLGNYQLTLFTHISGEYELITGQRAWGRMNIGDKPNTGVNRSELVWLNDNGQEIKRYQLTGMSSLAADPKKTSRVFGCGFANYTSQVDDFKVERILSVKPSTNPYNGTSAFLLTVKIKNNTKKSVNLSYLESVTANYETIEQQGKNKDARRVKYTNTVSIDSQNQLIKADNKSLVDDPLLFPTKESMSMFEGYPPALFMKALTSGANLREENGNELIIQYPISLKPKEEKIIEIIIGYTFEESYSSIEQIEKELTAKSPGVASKKAFNSSSAFAANWLKVLPKFDDEKDATLKRELVWHAYNLEAMATYSSFYKETKIPQGTIYDYDWGQHASARDNFQHALPLVYYNPELARSVIRYMLKRTTPMGEIKLIEYGNGHADNYSYCTSDQQLFFFLLMSEYLRVTGDYAFLSEEVPFSPAHNMTKRTVLESAQNCFTFLRDQVGIGWHGLVRLLNSDWNDAVYYTLKEPYNSVLFTGESHMNSAMAITILRSMVSELKKAENAPALKQSKVSIPVLCESMELYHSKVSDAFMKDLGDRTFSRRMYFNGKAFGDDNMFAEPQGYMMQMAELSGDRKKALYEEMKKRIYAGEKLGVRQQQTPEFEGDGWEPGSRENGGFWWALNGPVILGVALFDKEEATRLLKMMSFDNFAKQFPQYWTSYWAAADNIESSLIIEEGLPDQTWTYASIPVYCAHPHAWMLYCYYVINKPPQSPEQTSTWIRVNQAGYVPDRIKTAVVLSDVDITGESWSLKKDGVTVLNGNLPVAKPGDDIYVAQPYSYLIDFSKIQTEGDYTLELPGAQSQSIRILADPYSLFVAQTLMHLEAMRSGGKTRLHPPSHLGDAAAIVYTVKGDWKDGAWEEASPGRTLDMLGGHYDAGDYIKFTLTEADLAWHLLTAYQENPSFFIKVKNQSDLSDILEEAKYSLDYLAKTFPDPNTFVIQVGDSKDHKQGWRMPDKDLLDGKRPALCALSRAHMGLTAAALALGAQVFKDIDPKLAAVYQEKAIAIYARARQSDTLGLAFERDEVNDFYSDRTDIDNMALGAAELYRLTSNENYLEEAKTYAPPIARSIGWGTWNFNANYLIARLGKDAAAKARASEEIAQYEKDNIWYAPGGYTWGTIHRWIGMVNAHTRYMQDFQGLPSNTLPFLGMLDYVFGQNNWGISMLASPDLPYSVQNIFSGIYRVSGAFPIGALSEGPGNTTQHSRLSQYFSTPEDSPFDKFNTSAGVFYDNINDFMIQESTISGQGELLLMFALASKVPKLGT